MDKEKAQGKLRRNARLSGQLPSGCESDAQLLEDTADVDLIVPLTLRALFPPGPIGQRLPICTNGTLGLFAFGGWRPLKRG